MKQRELPLKWKSVRIRDIATIEKKVVTSEDLKYNIQNFIGLENIEKDTGRLVHFSETSKKELHSSKFKFTPEHILYGKLRPYLNKVFLPDFEGICSTDILTIRPHSEKIERKFLKLVLKQPGFIDYATTRSIGANLPRVSPTTVLDYSFPLPPLSVQRRIITVLEQAEAVKRQRHEAGALTGALLQSVFREMFGDLSINEKGWDLVKLENICTKITDGTHITPEYVEKGIPFLSVRNLTKGYLDFNDVKYISESAHQYITKRSKPEKGDILLTKVGVNYGIAEIVDVDTEFSIFVSLALLKPRFDLVDPYYLKHCINSNFVYRQAQNRISGIGVPDLHLVEIKQFKIPLPPLVLQQQFARVVQDVEQIREQQMKSGSKIEELIAGLMSSAFKGELITGNS